MKHYKMVIKVIIKFQNYPSIVKHESNFLMQEKFSFQPVTVKDVKKLSKTFLIINPQKVTYLFKYLSILNILAKF